MPLIKMIADSGSTKTAWCLLSDNKKKYFNTQGLSPYFLNSDQMSAILSAELAKEEDLNIIDEVYFYGTGCSGEVNAAIVKKALQLHFTKAEIFISHDLLGAAKAMCGKEKGIVNILGTGSNTGYFDGKNIIKNSPGIGYILGDEGSGTYLGKKVLQYYLYNIFDPELKQKFDIKYNTNSAVILQKVYKEPLPNRFLASFSRFLSENRGHYMVENILEDGFNDFFFNHIIKFDESRSHPIHFVGGIANSFSDVLIDVCRSYELTPGNILENPIEALATYHDKN